MIYVRRGLIWGIFPLIYFCCIFKVHSQVGSVKTVQIYLEEFRKFVIIHPDSIPRKIVYKIGENQRLIYSIESLCGQGVATLIDTDSNIIISGKYASSLELLSDYVINEEIMTGEQSISIHDYYQPIPIGEWVWFEKNGKLLKKETYQWKNYPWDESCP